MKPLVSVIMPVYNNATFILEALASVERALQGVKHEVIVINDGSTDNVESVLTPCQDQIIFQTQAHQGPAAARNAGLAIAQGSLVAFIDADDVWTPTHFSVLFDLLERHPDKQVAAGFSQRYLYQATQAMKNAPLSEHKPVGPPVFMSSVGCALFRSSIFQQVGKFNPEYHWHEDVDWYLRAREMGVEVIKTRQVVKFYRLHQHNTTKDWHPRDHHILHVIAASLARRKVHENTAEN